MKRFGLRAAPEEPALLQSTHSASPFMLVTASVIIKAIWQRTKSSFSSVSKQEKDRKWTVSVCVCVGKQPVVCEFLTRLPSNIKLTLGMYVCWRIVYFHLYITMRLSSFQLFIPLLVKTAPLCLSHHWFPMTKEWLFKQDHMKTHVRQTSV